MHKQVTKEVLKELVRLNKGVYLIDTQLKIPLKPQYFNCVKEGVRKVLDESIFTYNSKISGFLLGYKKFKVSADPGVVLPDSGESVISVSVKFYVFNPAEGDHLTGITTKVTKKHLACLIYGIINGSLKIPKAERNSGNTIEVGSNVNFSVKQVHLHDRVPLIEGEYLSISSDAPISLVPEPLPKSPKQGKADKRDNEGKGKHRDKKRKVAPDEADNEAKPEELWFSTPFPTTERRRSVSDSTEEMFGNLSPVGRKDSRERTNGLPSKKAAGGRPLPIINECKENGESAECAVSEVIEEKGSSKKHKKVKKIKQGANIENEKHAVSENDVSELDADYVRNSILEEKEVNVSNPELVAAKKSPKKDNENKKYKGTKRKKLLDNEGMGPSLAASDQDSLIAELVAAKKMELFEPPKKKKTTSKKKATPEPVFDAKPNVKKTTEDIISELLQRKKQLLFGGPGAEKGAKPKKKLKKETQ